MKIANVVYEKELVNHTRVDYVNYFSGATEYEKLDRSLPTLYVGWSFMKASNPDNQIIQNADILKKKIITNELYWECSFEESKSSHVKGVDGFVNLAPQFYFQPKYQYVNLDPVFFQIVDIQGLCDVLPKEKDAVLNFKREMLYILKGNKITGVDLKMYAFFKFDIDEIISEVSNKSARYINDQDGQMYINQYKIFPNFSQLKRYLVVIFSR